MIAEAVASEACVAFFTIDSARRVLEWPLAAAETFGVPAEAALGRRCSELVAPAQNGGRYRCAGRCPVMERDWARPRLPSKRLSIRRRDGTKEDLVCQPFRLPGNAATFLVLLSKPGVSGKKVDQPNTGLNVLRELVTALQMTVQLADSADGDGRQRLLAALRKAAGADSVELFVREPLTGDLVLTAFDGEAIEAFAEPPRFHLGEDYPGLTAASEGPVLSHSLAADPRWSRAAARARGFHAYAGMRLAVHGEVVGTLGLAWKDVRAPLQVAGRLLSWVAPSLAVALAAEFAQLSHTLPSGGRPYSPEDWLRHVVVASEAAAGRIIMLPPDGLTRSCQRSTGRNGPWPRCPFLEGGDATCPAVQEASSVARPSRTGYVGTPVACDTSGPPVQCFPLWSAGGARGVLQLIYRTRLPAPVTRHVAEIARLVPSLPEPPWSGRTPEPVRVGAPGEVWFYGLGPFAVYRDGRPLYPQVFKHPKALTLLKILLLAAGRPLNRDRLVEFLWPDSEPEAGASRLYVLAHRLRSLLARDLPEVADRLYAARGGYSLRLEGPIHFDLLEFERRAREGWEALRAGHPQAAVVAFEAAAVLYRGDLYDDDADADWCQAAREEFREQYLSLLLGLARAYQDLGMVASSIGCYRRLLARDPLREDAHRGLMESLWACGRRAEALEQYRRCAALIRQELGSDPSPETRQLYERLRGSLVD